MSHSTASRRVSSVLGRLDFRAARCRCWPLRKRSSCPGPPISRCANHSRISERSHPTEFRDRVRRRGARPCCSIRHHVVLERPVTFSRSGSLTKRSSLCAMPFPPHTRHPSDARLVSCGKFSQGELPQARIAFRLNRRHFGLFSAGWHQAENSACFISWGLCACAC
jgi:hypothetical protein